MGYRNREPKTVGSELALRYKWLSAINEELDGNCDHLRRLTLRADKALLLDEIEASEIALRNANTPSDLAKA